jgi:hypothetical protein
MSTLNINRIAQLVGYGTLKETADYDFGGVEPRTQKVAMIASKPGEADLGDRMINNQGDNPLEVEEGMEGTCEPDPQFDGLDEDYLLAMINMMQRTPIMASAEANIQWMAAAKAELARREVFAQASAQAEMDADCVNQDAAVQTVQAIIDPTGDQVSALVDQSCCVMIDREGRPEQMTVIQDGRFFVTAKNEETGETEIFPRDEWDNIVLDNDSMYDNVRVGDRLPAYDDASTDDDVTVLGFGEDEEMDEDDAMVEAPWDADTNKECDDVDHEYDDIPKRSMSVNPKTQPVEEGVMDTIRQSVNPETMSKAHSVLTKAGISDTAIMNRDVNMKPSGWTKLAHILSKEAMADCDAEDYCKHVLHALADKLEEGKAIAESTLNEFEGMGGDQRFGYTTDSLGNVNITDARTGASLYLQGQDAQELLGDLAIHGSTPEATQAILSQYEHVLDGQTDDDGAEVGLDMPTSSSVDAFGF